MLKEVLCKICQMIGSRHYLFLSAPLTEKPFYRQFEIQRGAWVGHPLPGLQEIQVLPVSWQIVSGVQVAPAIVTQFVRQLITTVFWHISYLQVAISLIPPLIEL